MYSTRPVTQYRVGETNNRITRSGSCTGSFSVWSRYGRLPCQFSDRPRSAGLLLTRQCCFTARRATPQKGGLVQHDAGSTVLEEAEMIIALIIWLVFLWLAWLAGQIDPTLGWVLPVVFVLPAGIAAGWFRMWWYANREGGEEGSGVSPFWPIATAFFLIGAVTYGGFWGWRLAFPPEGHVYDQCESFYALIETTRPPGDEACKGKIMIPTLQKAMSPLGDKTYEKAAFDAMFADLYGQWHGDIGPADYPFPATKQVWEAYQADRANFIVDRLKVAVPTLLIVLYAIGLLTELIAMITVISRHPGLAVLIALFGIWNLLVSGASWLWFHLPEGNESLEAVMTLGVIFPIIPGALGAILSLLQGGVEKGVDLADRKIGTDWLFRGVLILANILMFLLAGLGIFQNQALILVNGVFPFMINSVVMDTTITMTQVIVAFDIGFLIGTGGSQLVVALFKAALGGGGATMHRIHELQGVEEE